MLRILSRTFLLRLLFGFFKGKGHVSLINLLFLYGCFWKAIVFMHTLGNRCQWKLPTVSLLRGKKSKYKMATPHKVRNIVTKELDHETSFFIPFKKAKYVFDCFKTKNK